jgi:hypothetical protein
VEPGDEAEDETRRSFSHDLFLPPRDQAEESSQTRAWTHESQGSTQEEERAPGRYGVGSLEGAAGDRCDIG